MDLRHIRTFVTVAELGTVSKAALRLRIAQPALSRQLIDLEQELGLQLFDRVGRRLLLTGEGEQLLSGCRILLNSASAVTEQAQLLRHGDTGVLRIAGSPQHIEGVLSQFLHRYADRYPKVEVKISEGTGIRDIDAARTGRNPPRTEFTARRQTGRAPLWQPSARIGGAAGSLPSSMPLGHRRTIEVAHLAGLPLLLMDSGFGFRRAFDAASRMAGLSPTIMFESRNRILCWHLRRPGTAWRSFPRSSSVTDIN